MTLLAATVVGTIAQIIFSALLTLAPAATLQKRDLHVTVFLSFLAIFSTSFVAGLVMALPLTIALILFSFWIVYLSSAQSRPKRVLFFITLALAGLFLLQHLIHLPIRIIQNQAESRIAGNVAGIFVATALAAAPLEILLRRNNKDQPAPAPSPETVE